MIEHEILSPSQDRPVLFEFNLNLNYQQLAEQIVRHLRGDITQRQLSANLGFTFNQVGKWESGATQIKWDDFLYLCKILEVPIEKYFRNTFWMIDTEFNALSTIISLDNNLGLSLSPYYHR